MSKVSSFGFTNTTDSTTVTVVPKLLGLTTNYAVATESADEARLNNKTCPIDQEEIVSFRSRNIQKVDTDLNIQYPSPVKKGIQYQIMIEDTLSTTDTADASFRVDEPIVAQLTIRHPKSGNISNTEVVNVVKRLLSACIKTDGTWRFDDLMRQAEKPVVD
jgi:hypothetical protein